jgi:hypothetical protein
MPKWFRLWAIDDTLRPEGVRYHGGHFIVSCNFFDNDDPIAKLAAMPLVAVLCRDAAEIWLLKRVGSLHWIGCDDGRVILSYNGFTSGHQPDRDTALFVGCDNALAEVNRLHTATT